MSSEGALIAEYLTALAKHLEPSCSIEIPGILRAARDVRAGRHQRYVEVPDDSSPAEINAALAKAGIIT